MRLETKYSRLVSLARLLWNKGWVDLKKDVVKGSAEVGTVDGGVARGLWVVHVLASCAVELYGFEVRVVGLTHWEERVALACDTRAFAKVSLLVLFELDYVSPSLSSQTVFF